LHILAFSSLLLGGVGGGHLYAQTDNVQVATGQFTANWQSLAAWECPEWFRDAKFGIWAHWDPQCEAEDGDWYARSMYGPNSSQWNTFKNIFGTPPSKTMGYKDLCDHWKADKWDPEALIQLYADAGAKYFMAMGQHHDNFDCWDSPYQEWNSTRIGPLKDIVGGWAEACRRHGLKLGVSMHGAHAWTFFEVGDAYDVHMTKEDGMATNADGSFKYWWHGYDPQELYAQNHAHSANWSDWVLYTTNGDGAMECVRHRKNTCRNSRTACCNVSTSTIPTCSISTIPYCRSMEPARIQMISTV